MEIKAIKNFKNPDLIYDIGERMKKGKSNNDYHVFNKFAAELIIGEERFDDSCVIDGSGDGGIDFYLIDEEENQEIILGQSKYVLKTSNEQIIETAEKVKRFISRISSSDTTNLNLSTSSLITRLEDAIENIKTIKICLIFSVDFEANDNLKSELKKIQKSITNIDQVKNNNIEIEIAFYNVKDLENLYESSDVPPGVDAKLELIDKNSHFEIKKKDYKVIFAVIKGKSLWKLFKNLNGDLIKKEAILSKNVRGYIRDTKIDEKIKTTIDNEPDNFLVKNNGLTIISQNIVIDGTELKFEKMYIINGGQTSHLISTIGTGDKLEDVNLFIKVLDFQDLNDNDNDNLIIKIAESSNSQKPIRPLDIISYDKHVIKFKQNLAKHDNVKYILFDKRNASNPKVAKEKNMAPLYSLGLIKIYFDFFALMPGKAKNGLDTILLSNPNYNFFKIINILDSNNFAFFNDLMWIVEKIEEFYNTKIKDSKSANKDVNSVRDSNYYNLIKNGRHFLLAFIGAIFLKQAVDLYRDKEGMTFNFSNAEEYTKKYDLNKILKNEFNSNPDFYDLLEKICDKILIILGEQTPIDFAGKTKRDDFFYEVLNKYFTNYFYSKTKKDDVKARFEDIFESLKFKKNKKIDFS